MYRETIDDHRWQMRLFALLTIRSLSTQGTSHASWLDGAEWENDHRIDCSFPWENLMSPPEKTKEHDHFIDRTLNEKQSIIWRATCQWPPPSIQLIRLKRKESFSTGMWVSCSELRLFITESLSWSQKKTTTTTTRLLFIYNQIIFNARNTRVNESFKSVKKMNYA